MNKQRLKWFIAGLRIAFFRRMKHPREICHETVRTLMKEGDFLKALGEGQKAINDYGPHILLLTDIASCYYMLGDYWNYHKLALQLHEDLTQIKPKLNLDSYLGATLGIGKLLEELSHIYAARKVYEKVINLTI